MGPQTAAGKVLLHFTMSLDGFVAGPDHDMSWMAGLPADPVLIEQYVTTTGAAERPLPPGHGVVKVDHD